MIRQSLGLLFVCLAACHAYDPPGPTPPGGLFAPCCGELGSCIPAAVAPQGLAQMLARDACGPALVCAPDAYIDDPAYTAPACAPFAGQEGRCVPGCLLGVGPQTRRLRQQTCMTGEVCVPCFDPLSGQETGACRIGPDAPRTPAQPFERCCGSGADSAGACVPGDLLSEPDRAALRADSCTDPAAACVPVPLLAASEKLVSCTRSAMITAPQVCVRECFLGPRLGGFLPQATCAAGERCVPCADLGMMEGCQ